RCLSVMSSPRCSTLFPYTTLFRSRFPKYRIFIMALATLIGAVLWLALDRTRVGAMIRAAVDDAEMAQGVGIRVPTVSLGVFALRSEEHTSELQSRGHLVCRLLLEK